MTEAIVGPRAALPILGTREDQREALVAGLGASVVSILYVMVARQFDTPTTRLEFAALVFNLACVWLARTENIWAMPYGLLASLLLGAFLFDVELVGQAWLQYAYFVPVQILGWWTWARGGEGRTELPVTRMGVRLWAATALLGGALWAGCWLVFTTIYESPAFVGWDTSIVAASIVAQTLMTWKRREHWLFWIAPVNISSIALFAYTDAWAFSFLYLVFLANAVWGWMKWKSVVSADD